MHEPHVAIIARELSIKSRQVAATAALLDDGATVPFIARYRKEMTGSLDEVAITTIRDRLSQLRELDKRREAILKSLEERGLLTDKLKQQIMAAGTMAVLEDIYLPYRPKRRTRATVAREKGLERLAQRLFAQEPMDPDKEAAAFIDPEKGVESVEDALAGARDIIAEWVNEDQTARATMRDTDGQTGQNEAAGAASVEPPKRPKRMDREKRDKRPKPRSPEKPKERPKKMQRSKASLDDLLNRYNSRL